MRKSSARKKVKLLPALVQFSGCLFRVCRRYNTEQKFEYFLVEKENKAIITGQAKTSSSTTMYSKEDSAGSFGQGPIGSERQCVV